MSRRGAPPEARPRRRSALTESRKPARSPPSGRAANSLGGDDQLVQVLEPALGLGRALPAERLAAARAVDDRRHPLAERPRRGGRRPRAAAIRRANSPSARPARPPISAPARRRRRPGAAPRPPPRAPPGGRAWSARSPRGGAPRARRNARSSAGLMTSRRYARASLTSRARRSGRCPRCGTAGPRPRKASSRTRDWAFVR